MVNYRTDALWPWLSFEPSEGPPGLADANGTGPMGIRLMAGAYEPVGDAATPTPSRNEVGLANWRPANANRLAQYVTPPAPPGPELQPFWFGNRGNELNWRRLRLEPPDGSPRLEVNSNGIAPADIRLMAGAYDPRDQAATPTPGGDQAGLSNWRPPNANLFAQYVTPPAPPGAEPQPSWFGPQGSDEEIRPELKWPWLRVESEDELSGSRGSPDSSIASAPAGNLNAFSSGWRSQDFGQPGLFGVEQFTPYMGQPSEASETEPWWSRIRRKAKDPRVIWSRAGRGSEPSRKISRRAFA